MSDERPVASEAEVLYPERCATCNVLVDRRFPCGCEPAAAVLVDSHSPARAHGMAHANTGLYTRERALRAMGFDPQHLAEAYTANREALHAVASEKRKVKTKATGETEETIEEGGAPDWSTRLKATELLYSLGGVRNVELEQDERKNAPLTIKVVVGESQPAKPSTVTAVSVQVPQ